MSISDKNAYAIGISSLIAGEALSKSKTAIRFITHLTAAKLHQPNTLARGQCRDLRPDRGHPLVMRWVGAAP